MSYLIKWAAQTSNSSPLLFFDFCGDKYSRTRLQSKASYARLRETVGQAYKQFALAGC